MRPKALLFCERNQVGGNDFDLMWAKSTSTCFLWLILFKAVILSHQIHNTFKIIPTHPWEGTNLIDASEWRAQFSENRVETCFLLKPRYKSLSITLTLTLKIVSCQQGQESHIAHAKTQSTLCFHCHAIKNKNARQSMQKVQNLGNERR